MTTKSEALQFTSPVKRMATAGTSSTTAAMPQMKGRRRLWPRRASGVDGDAMWCLRVEWAVSHGAARQSDPALHGSEPRLARADEAAMD